ncbi:hypothetical protein [Clostridium fungisolvens]|uniref:DUF3784 domain-containing protein n=1 Tax=Clostridium fungisolvens TaxID=1604897 RepID=A0A6V8SNR3_9CLOT|nr:hypothetical protein [Clostridium fungisolvens]GFP78451.1 hypothetical protein bsdtw1_04676 [Clostridium fungisolvens]
MEGYEYILIAVGFVLLLLSYLVGMGNKSFSKINDNVTSEDIEEKDKFISEIAIPPALIGMAIIISTFLYRVSKLFGIILIIVVSIYSLIREFKMLFSMKNK